MQEDLIFNLKEYFRKSPRIYSLLMRIFGVSIVGVSPKDFLKRFFKDGYKVLNLGSGTRRIGKEVLNVDIVKYEGVDVVADILNLPF
ncbi:MAG: hypothetical protein HY001_02820, partial [Candidatus Portnoybacteria bacterium]|nr:hypothetical protein [Candidatus Portnoybacteria bacterium]